MRTLFVLALLSLAACGADPKPKPAHPRKNTLFVAELVQGLGDPEIVITNDSDLTLVLTLQGTAPATLQVPPRATVAVRVKAGTYAYRASGAGVEPFDGGQSFDADHRYAFRFFVVTKTDDDPEFVGKGWHCYDAPGTIVMYVCGRTATSCETARARPLPPDAPPNGTCQQKAVMHRFSETAEHRALYAPTHEQCETLRAAYQKQFPTVTLSPCEEKN